MSARFQRGSTSWSKSEARHLDGRRRNIVAVLQAAGWRIGLDLDGQQWAFPPGSIDGYGQRVALPGTLVSERQARNLETALRSIGPYPRQERR